MPPNKPPNLKRRMVYNLLFHAPLPTHLQMRVILILNCLLIMLIA